MPGNFMGCGAPSAAGLADAAVGNAHSMRRALTRGWKFAATFVKARDSPCKEPHSLAWRDGPRPVTAA